MQYPTDGSLLGDAVRCLAREARGARLAAAAPPGPRAPEAVPLGALAVAGAAASGAGGGVHGALPGAGRAGRGHARRLAGRGRQGARGACGPARGPVRIHPAPGGSGAGRGQGRTGPAAGVGTARTTGPGWMRCSTSRPCRAPGSCRRPTGSGRRRHPSRRAHPAIESAIHGWEPSGLDRVRSRGADGFARTVARAVLAANLPRLGLLLTAAEAPLAPLRRLTSRSWSAPRMARKRPSAPAPSNRASRRIARCSSARRTHPGTKPASQTSARNGGFLADTS